MIVHEKSSAIASLNRSALPAASSEKISSIKRLLSAALMLRTLSAGGGARLEREPSAV